MSGKRRFGVSLPVEIAEELDLLAKITNSDRSSIIAEALKQYLHDHLHYLTRCNCMGLIIALKKKELSGYREIVDKYTHVVKNYVHFHIGDLCIEIFLVMGDNEEVVKLHNDIKRITPSVRYVPLATIYR